MMINNGGYHGYPVGRDCGEVEFITMFKTILKWLMYTPLQVSMYTPLQVSLPQGNAESIMIGHDESWSVDY